MKSIVALDLETTGLDPLSDEVIEIGAVRFSGPRIEAEWSTLVNPGRPLTPYITQLTGITDAMLAGAPRLVRVLPALLDFVGDDPVVGHNVAFDVAFLNRHGALTRNPALDTYDLASVLLPTAARYRLSALAQVLGVVPEAAHRALPDARTTSQIYSRLLVMASDLPREVLQEIIELGANLDWGAGIAFEAVGEALPPLPPSQPPRPRRTAPSLAPPLEPREQAEALHPAEASAVLEPGGDLSRVQAGYEHRSQQIRMTEAVAEALTEGRHLLVEAGTGTGKSLAYLIPAFLWARRNGQRVVVSTNTINLQDQLMRKDIPLLRRVLGEDLRAAVLKGRSNYLCPARLESLRRLRPRSPEEMRVLAKVLVWLAQGGSGDRTDLTLGGPAETAAWSRLSADDEGCSLEACLERTGGACPYFAARTQAEAAHVVIVNHALLMADIQAGGRVLPAYRQLIIDEGHHLEAAMTSGMAARIHEADIPRTLRELAGGTSALLPEASALARRVLSPAAAREIGQAVETIESESRQAIQAWGALFESLMDFVGGLHPEEAQSRFGVQVRIVGSLRSLPAWSDLEVGWEATRPRLTSIVSGVAEVADALIGLGGSGPAASDLAGALRASARSVREVVDRVEQIIFEPDPATIYWADYLPERRRLSLHTAPLAIGPLVERHLWNEKDSIVLTSATLTTAGEFDYLKRRLHADTADELGLGSPFDYESSTLLYLPNDIPEPADRMAYQRAVETSLAALARASEGRMLVLFTSIDQLKRTARSLSDSLAQDAISVYEQSEGSSRHALLESFRSDRRAVLLGTKSFWEGVDVPGEALSVLVMVRLPFDVPTDPIISARAETYESPFEEYSLPEAILRFRQGFGRLIRTRSDRGAVVVLDRRILTKRYGSLFLKSLPTCTVRQGSLRDAPREVARWLGV